MAIDHGHAIARLLGDGIASGGARAGLHHHAGGSGPASGHRLVVVDRGQGVSAGPAVITFLNRGRGRSADLPLSPITFDAGVERGT